MEKQSFRWRFFKLSLRIMAGFFVTSLTLVFIYRFVPVYYTPLMALRSWEALWSPKPYDTEHKWVPLDKISSSVRRAVIKAEDYRFQEHKGFDFEAIEKAMRYNRTHKIKKGASTISQQTAKNVFLWPQRSWLRKGLEAYFTVLIETFWPKDRIMEVYLNVIELGPGVYGVEAAANKFFKKKAVQLNSYEASLMAAVLPNPRRFRIDRPSSYVLSRQRRIMNRPQPMPIKVEAPPPDAPQETVELKLEDES